MFCHTKKFVDGIDEKIFMDKNKAANGNLVYIMGKEYNKILHFRSSTNRKKVALIITAKKSLLAEIKTLGPPPPPDI